MIGGRAAGLRVGVDIGGTFTDLVFLLPDGTLDRRKVPSTPDDYARAIVESVETYLEQAGAAAGTVAEVVHATTVATNAILERKGAKTALITTEGFRDVLELRRIRIPFSYDLSWEKPPPLVERALRFEIPERLDHEGEVVTPFESASLEPVIEAIEAEEVESVAVCFLHSYRNPVHERRVGDLLRQRLGDRHVSLSSEVLREIQEYERTSTTVVNAYVAPLVGRYLAALRRQLADLGVKAPLLVMQSNGGLIPAGTAAARPVTIIESGPAAGVVAATRAAAEAGEPDIITLDMGGTTSKASIIEAGHVLRAKEYEVGAEVSVSSRLVRGSGYLLRMPVIDVSEVGAGGGSLAGVDVGGAVRVGPHSAGAVPGPACYGRGNERPTVTDSNLVLGYLHAGSLAGGALTVEQALAERAVAEHVAGPTGLPLIEAAYGIHEIANSNMVRAIKTISVERGRDPAGYVLMAFGGAGPIHAAGVARALGMPRVLVPPAPGLFSAFGLLRALVEHHTARTVLARTDEIDLDFLADTFAGMRDEVLRRAREEGFAADDVTCDAAVDLRYAGQSSEITVLVDAAHLSRQDLRAAETAFEAEYERTYGHRGEWKAFELVNCRLVATVRRAEEHEGRWRFEANGAAPPQARRDAYFGSEHGMLDTPILGRAGLDETGLEGPAIIEEYNSTIVVPPGSRVRRDDRWNVLIDVRA